MPLAIIYAPPGDCSNATYAISKMFTNKTSLSSSWASKFKDTTTVSESFAASVGLKIRIPDIGSVSFGADYKHDWDTSTTTASGETQTNSTVRTLSSTDSVQWTAQAPLAANNAGIGLQADDSQPVSQEPFWFDEIVLIPHPVYAVWNYSSSDGSQSSIQAIHQYAQETGHSEASVAELADCELDPAGCVLNQTLGDNPLSPLDCAQLLALDPVYSMQWQGWPGCVQTAAQQELKVGCSPLHDTKGRTHYMDNELLGPQPSSRGTVNQCPNGTVKVGEVDSGDVDATYSDELTYGSTVENDDKVSVSANAGLTYEPTKDSTSGTIGVSGGHTVSSSTTTEFDFTEKIGSESDIKNTVTVNGNLGNSKLLNSGKQSIIYIYQDKIFGGLMFQDVNEALPRMVERVGPIKGPNGVPAIPLR